MMSMMAAANTTSKATNSKKSGHPSWIPKTGKRPKSSMKSANEKSENSKEYSANSEKKQEVQGHSGATTKTYTEEEKIVLVPLWK